MVADVSEVIGAALALSVSDRETLVHRVSVSLDRDSKAQGGAVAAAWDDEIASRVNEICSGQVQGIPWEQVKAAADQVAAVAR